MRFGPESATIERAAAALRARGFSVTEQTRSLHVTGTASQVQSAFGTKLFLATAEPGKTHIINSGALHLPPELSEAGAEIYSFSPRVSHVHSQIVSKIPIKSQNRYSVTGAYWFDDLKQAYSYPSALATVTVKGTTQPLNGTGVTIGALMSSDVLDSDIQAVFDHEKWSTISGTPDPTLFARVDIDGGGGIGGGAFAEASLDTQEEITGAPGAHVILYNIPDLSDGSIQDGYVTLIEQNAVDAVSSSFGGCELFDFPKYNGGTDYRGVLRALHELFLQGNSQGITFLASSGDSAGRECPSPNYFEGHSAVFLPGIETPAADPNVTAVGGTNVITTYVQGSLDSVYAGENAWADPEKAYDPYGVGEPVLGGFWGAGGGYSSMWPQPAYQAGVTTGSTTARAVPDVGMQVGGCPGGISKLTKGECDGGDLAINGNGNTQRSAVIVAINTVSSGYFYGLIGTSVSSPEFTGALALLIEQKGRMGNLNPYLYNLAGLQAKNPKLNVFHTNIPGYNGVVNTDLNNSYSLSVGVGTPIVSSLVNARTLPLAGTPQTPINP
jgi:subtilase family serine protease